MLRTLAVTLLLGAATSPLATAAGPVDPINRTKQSLAIHGYDPVAYFRQNQPVKGTAQFTHDFAGAKWQFASAENRDLFAAESVKYAPQYGGYCAWAVSRGYTADVDPLAWKVVDGKLYLNYNKDVQAKWSQDVSGNISAADKNWPGLHK